MTVRASITTRGAALAACLLSFGCGKGDAPPAAPTQAPAKAPARDERASIGAESEIGGLDEDRVKRAFEKAAPAISACFDRGVERIPFLRGDVAFKLRIARDGATRWAYVKDSTLGDRKTEACMLDVLKGVSWPRPLGGEGLAENSFSFEPGGDAAKPVDWSPAQLGASLATTQSELSRCRRKAGTGKLKATLYVAPDGKPRAVGVSTADERGEPAASCVVEAINTMTFPSPDGPAAKVTVSSD